MSDKAKLYEVPPGSTIRIDDQMFIFHRLDGAYSYCTTEKNEPVHLAAWTEVEVVETPK